MKQEIKPKECKNPGCGKTFTPRNSFDKFCSWPCAKPHVKPIQRKPIDPAKTTRTRIKRKPIKTMSTKMKSELAKYQKSKLEFMAKPANKLCPVNSQPTTDVHHKMGRVGFADQFARDNDISLLHDQRFWLAVSRTGHRWIEENPVQAKERGWSMNRL